MGPMLAQTAPLNLSFKKAPFGNDDYIARSQVKIVGGIEASSIGFVIEDKDPIGTFDLAVKLYALLRRKWTQAAGQRNRLHDVYTSCEQHRTRPKHFAGDIDSRLGVFLVLLIDRSQGDGDVQSAGIVLLQARLQDILYCLRRSPGDVARMKPHPEPILAALRSVDVAPAQAWMIGDGPQDIEAARAAGVTAIAYRGGYGDAAASADLAIDDFAELISRLP